MLRSQSLSCTWRFKVHKRFKLLTVDFNLCIVLTEVSHRYYLTLYKLKFESITASRQAYQLEADNQYKFT
jgi:hypothetical protein